MKHLIELTDESSLTREDYDRIILDSETDGIIVWWGGDYSNDYPYVDLGLSVKWAKCNVGAKKETDYGDYFQWGSITPDTNNVCNWTNAPFNNRENSYNSTYFDSVKDDVCPNGILAKEYDAAAQIMGGNWRMPTEAEFQELLNNTESKWVQNYNNSGVNGRKFTASNGNSIFIPASGYREGDRVNDVRFDGDVWSSSLIGLEGEAVDNFEVARHLVFDSGRFGSRLQYTSRSYGLPVRGVCK